MDSISDSINNFSSKVGSFFDSIGNILSYIWNIIEAIWFAINSFLSMIWDLVLDIFDSGIDTYITQSFNYISSYIGGPTTVVLSCVLFLAIFRIFFAFIMKLFKGNISYHSLQYKSNWWSENPNGYDFRKK